MARVSKRSKAALPSVAGEFEGAELGDPRRTRRLLGLAEAFAQAPEKSFPKIARDSGELEAFYRFFGNEAFSFEDLVRPHAIETARRTSAYDTVVAIHDLTEFSFPLDEFLREGCERFGARQGFFGQVALAVAGDGSKKPLGVLGCETWTKAELPPRKRPHQKRSSQASPNRNWHACGKTEGARWAQFAARAEAVAGMGRRLVHVMDREADGYGLFHTLIEAGSRFVNRISGTRGIELVAEAERVKASEAADRLASIHEVEVPLSRRRAKKGFKRVRPRRARRAKLSFRAAAVTLKRPANLKAAEFPATLPINLVWVKEIDPPEGEDPVEWILATTEPIATSEDVLRIVDFYKTRWMIEEFFRALKSGCAFERRQLETRDALEKVLAISLVVAWRVLLLRHESRREPDGPATSALSDLHIQVLRVTGRIPLPKHPNTRQTLLAVAALGGHIKNNGEPGLIVLARGMETLLERVVGWSSALAALGMSAEM